VKTANHDIQAARFRDDFPDRLVTGLLRRHVQFDSAKIHFVFLGELGNLLDLRSVATCRLAHAGIDAVAG
jgi:hypothetical protein